MQIIIDNRCGKPIYDQIFSQIKAQIISGAIKTDALLPSVRNLAKDLRISVITTKRAYDELEREGFIYTIPGKGCFVSPISAGLMREENLKKIEKNIAEILDLAKTCQLSRRDIIAMIDFEEDYT